MGTPPAASGLLPIPASCPKPLSSPWDGLAMCRGVLGTSACPSSPRSESELRLGSSIRRLEEMPPKSTPAPRGAGLPEAAENEYGCYSCHFLAGLVQMPGLSQRACDWPVQGEGGSSDPPTPPRPPPLPHLSQAPPPSCWPRLRGPACEVFVPNLGSPLSPRRPGPPPGRSASPSRGSQTSIAPHLSPPLLWLRPPCLGRKRPA